MTANKMHADEADIDVSLVVMEMAVTCSPLRGTRAPRSRSTNSFASAREPPGNAVLARDIDRAIA
jgi:hypothetical protein